MHSPPFPLPLVAAAGRTIPDNLVTACMCDMCGSKGFASPPDGKVNVHDILKFMMHMHHAAKINASDDDHPADVNNDGRVRRSQAHAPPHTHPAPAEPSLVGGVAATKACP